MTIARPEQEPPSQPSSENRTCIGIALVGEDIQVAARDGDCEIVPGHFPVNPLGTAALLKSLVDARWNSAGACAGNCLKPAG